MIRVIVKKRKTKNRYRKGDYKASGRPHMFQRDDKTIGGIVDEKELAERTRIEEVHKNDDMGWDVDAWINREEEIKEQERIKPEQLPGTDTNTDISSK